MKTVYRIEAPNNIGPYTHKKTIYLPQKIKVQLLKHEESVKHQVILKDAPDNITLEINAMAFTEDVLFLCGFYNIKDLFKWFGGLIPMFYKLTDFRIVKYQVAEIDIYYTIDGQLIFKTDKKFHEQY